MEKLYDHDIIGALKESAVLIVWDGDNYDETGFTRLIPQFLRANLKGKAVAFAINYEVDFVKQDWEDIVNEFPGRLFVVPCALIAPDWEDAANHGITEEMKVKHSQSYWERPESSLPEGAGAGRTTPGGSPRSIDLSESFQHLWIPTVACACPRHLSLV